VRLPFSQIFAKVAKELSSTVQMMPMNNCEVFVLRQKIRQIIKEHAQIGRGIESLDDSSNLYFAGMTSHSNVALMLALENEFSLEFTPDLMNRSAFESVDSIALTIESLLSHESISTL
jgi:acyl carrier protein